MRKPFWIVPALLLSVAIGVPAAHADTITDGTIIFAVSSGSTIPTATFVYDNTTNQFTSLNYTYGAVTFPDESAQANTESTVTLPGCGDAGLYYVFVTDGCGDPSWMVTSISLGVVYLDGIEIGDTTSSFDFVTDDAEVAPGNGTYNVVIESTTIPEPSAFILTLAGIGLLGLTMELRKRKALALSSAT